MTNPIAQIIAALEQGEIVELTSAYRRGGERIEETHRAVVGRVDRDPRPNWKGVLVVGFSYRPAWDEPQWCGHGVYFAAVDGEVPRWSIVAIRRTGERERRMPPPFTPRPGDRAYDNMH